MYNGEQLDFAQNDNMLCINATGYLWDADTMGPISDKITMQFN